MNVSDRIAIWLADKGITDVFGVTGSGVIAIFEALAKRGKAKIQCFHHEQAALQAAVFYNRYSGRHAACLVTTGAGSSNAITGILCAWMDSIPLLVIAGNEPTHFLTQNVRAKGAQGFDFYNTVERITKFSIRANATIPVPMLLETALHEATSDRCGPVVVEIPINIQNTTL